MNQNDTIFFERATAAILVLFIALYFFYLIT